MTSTVRSTARCSRGATVTGTILGAVEPLPAPSGPSCPQPDAAARSRVPPSNPHEISRRKTDMIMIPGP